MMGVMMLETKTETILLNAPPMTTATARSITFPLRAVSYTHLFRLPFNFVGVCHGLHELDHAAAVSYTHLDVYKRQAQSSRL